MRDRFIEVVGVADYLAVIGMARNGAEAVILRHIFQITLPVVGLDDRSLPIDKALTGGAIRLRTQYLTIILRADSDIGALTVVFIR